MVQAWPVVARVWPVVVRESPVVAQAWPVVVQVWLAVVQESPVVVRSYLAWEAEFREEAGYLFVLEAEFLEVEQYLCFEAAL